MSRLLSSRLLIQSNLPETRKNSITYCVLRREPFALCQSTVEVYGSFHCSCCPFPFFSYCAQCHVETPFNVLTLELPTFPNVCFNCFHRERITRPTDEFCILSTGTTLPFPFLPHYSSARKEKKKKQGSFDNSKIPP